MRIIEPIQNANVSLRALADECVLRATLSYQSLSDIRKFQNAVNL